MQIRYTTFDNNLISYDTGGSPLHSEIITSIGLLYSAATREIPNRVFLGIKPYSELAQALGLQYAQLSSERDAPDQYVNFSFGFGVARLIPIIKPGVDFILVGQDKDYNRYIANDIIERELLK